MRKSWEFIFGATLGTILLLSLLLFNWTENTFFSKLTSVSVVFLGCLWVWFEVRNRSRNIRLLGLLFIAWFLSAYLFKGAQFSDYLFIAFVVLGAVEFTKYAFINQKGNAIWLVVFPLAIAAMTLKIFPEYDLLLIVGSFIVSWVFMAVKGDLLIVDSSFKIATGVFTLLFASVLTFTDAISIKTFRDEFLPNDISVIFNDPDSIHYLNLLTKMISLPIIATIVACFIIVMLRKKRVQKNAA
jgi:hypothetical protein